MSTLTAFLNEADRYKGIISERIQSEKAKDMYLSYCRTKYMNNCSSTECSTQAIADGYDYMMELATQPEMHFTENVILNFYHILYQKNIENPTECYRTVDTQGTDSSTETATFDIPHLMAHYANQIYTSSFSLHPIELAAFAHKRLIDIKPFEQGTKQIAFLVMNVILVHSGYPPMIIPEDLHEQYEHILSSTKNVLQIEAFIEFVTSCVISLEKEFLN